MKKLFTTLALLISTLAFSQTCITNNSSLQFNGNTSAADLSANNNLSLTDSVTVEAWVNASGFAATAAQGTIFCNHSWTGAAGEQGFVLRAGGSGIASWNFAGVDTNGTAMSWIDVNSPANALTVNNWFHVAGTFDGNASKLYVNGVLVATTTFNGTIAPSTNYMPKIGKLADGGVGQGRYWNGKIDEVRVWNRVLTSTEINANRSKHIDTSSVIGLVGYWRLNEGTGTSINDLSGSGNNGTLNSTTWSTVVPFVEQPAVPVVQNFPQLLNCLATGVTYQWNLAGTPILNATQQTYIPSATGAYTVTVTSPSGCSATSLPAQWTVGIDENELDKFFSFSPNPSSEFITLHLEKEYIYNTFSIVDLQGKLITEGLISEKDQKIDVSRLNSGSYLLYLIGKERKDARRMNIVH